MPNAIQPAAAAAVIVVVVVAAAATAVVVVVVVVAAAATAAVVVVSVLLFLFYSFLLFSNSAPPPPPCRSSGVRRTWPASRRSCRRSLRGSGGRRPRGREGRGGPTQRTQTRPQTGAGDIITIGEVKVFSNLFPLVSGVLPAAVMRTRTTIPTAAQGSRGMEGEEEAGSGGRRSGRTRRPFHQ